MTKSSHSGGGERRRHVRQAVALAARIETPDRRDVDCRIEDFCQGGMLLCLAETLPDSARPGLQQAIRLHPLPPMAALAPVPGPLVIEGRVVWTRGRYLGLSFTNQAAPSIAALMAHLQSINRNGPSDGADSSPGQLAAAPSSDTGIHEILRRLVRDLARNTADELLVTADEAPSTTEQFRVLADRDALQRLPDPDELLARLREAERARVPTDLTEPPSSAELTLIDQDDFERWLEGARLTRMVEDRLGADLARLNARFALAREKVSPDRLDVLSEPRHFTAVLQGIAEELDLGLTARRAFFDRAAKVLGDELPSLYRRIDAVLDTLAVPQVKVPSPSKLQSTSPRPATRSRIDRDAPALGDQTVSRASERDTQDAAGRASASIAAHLAARVRARDGASALIEDRAGVAQWQARERIQRIQFARELLASATDALDLAGDSAPGWLRQLEAPLTHAAQTDPAFFQQPDHPLRAILDGLAHLQALRGGGAMAGNDDPLSRRIAELIAALNADQADQDVWRATADAVAGLASETSRQYQHRVERVVESCDGRERARQARLAVAKALNRRYAGKAVPEVALELLNGGWRAVLERGWLNASGDLKPFQAPSMLLDQLIRALGGKVELIDGPVIPPQGLLDAIEADLATVAFDPFRRAAIVGRLRRELLHTAGLPSRLIEMPILEEVTQVAEPCAAPEGISADDWLDGLKRCRALRVGDQVRILDEASPRKDLRIAWIRPDQGVFALVDGRGLKAREITLSELALQLHRNQVGLRTIDGRPVSERVVDDMLDRMAAPLTDLAMQESLTGMIGRQRFHSELEARLERPTDDAEIGVLLLVDVDHFHLVNDLFGYECGDRLLCRMAELLGQLDQVTLQGHFGGDRFALLLSGLGLEEGTRLGEQLCGAVRELSFDWGGEGLALSASIGVVALAGANRTSRELLQSAEGALRIAKSAGGGQAHVFRGDDPAIARQRLSAQRVIEVDAALDGERLHLRCQPIVPVCATAGMRPHYEVLLGVAEPASPSGRAPIAELIEAAERYNRMRAIDRWVARTVIDWIAAHRERMPELHGFAVNLSGQTATDPAFVELVRERIQRTGIDPSWLSFEVTETAAIADLSVCAGLIGDLKGLGCRVALDDFGSGLASYSYLRMLPVDWLKIDGVFVRKIASNHDDYAVVKSINEIGHFLGKQTIAEYVTDAEVLRLIGEIGVDYAQGYEISAPFLMDDLLK